MPKRLAIAAIGGYQKFIRCLLPCSCRFVPSCSDYAKQAIAKYGVGKGSILTAKRLLRCHPFSGKSGFDPLL